MPLYAYQCVNGHQLERYRPTPDHRCSTVLCPECAHTMGQRLSVGRGLTDMRENRGQWLWNLGPEPVYVTSHEQHKRLMKENHRELAFPKRGMPNCWA